MAVRMFTDTEFFLEKAGAAKVDLVPTGITSADPAVVTVADVSQITQGDVVSFSDTGFAELDGKTFVVGTVDGAANTFEVVGADLSSSTGTLGATPKASVLTRAGMVKLCLNAFDPSPGSASEVDVGTFCKPTATLPGVTSAGSATFGGFTDKDDAGYKELLLAEDDGNSRQLLIVPKSNGYWVAPVVIGSVSWTYPLRSASEFSFSATFGDKLRHVF